MSEEQITLEEISDRINSAYSDIKNSMEMINLEFNKQLGWDRQILITVSRAIKDSCNEIIRAVEKSKKPKGGKT